MAGGRITVIVFGFCGTAFTATLADPPMGSSREAPGHSSTCGEPQGSPRSFLALLERLKNVCRSFLGLLERFKNDCRSFWALLERLKNDRRTFLGLLESLKNDSRSFLGLLERLKMTVGHFWHCCNSVAFFIRVMCLVWVVYSHLVSWNGPLGVPGRASFVRLIVWQCTAL